MVLYGPGYWLAGADGAEVAWGVATAVLVIARHAGNIQRLVSGSERTVRSE